MRSDLQKRLLRAARTLKKLKVQERAAGNNAMMGGPASGLLMQIALAVSKLRKVAKDPEMVEGLTQVNTLVEKAWKASMANATVLDQRR